MNNAIGYLTAHDYDEERKSVYQETTIDGYTPRNNKCFCFPYCYLVLTNNCGENITLKWENFDYSGFDNIHVQFEIYETGSESPCFTVYPVRYAGLTNNLHYGVSYNNFPQLPWSYDVFSNWFALHENSTMFNLYSNTFNTLADAVVGDFSSAVHEATNAVSHHLQLLDMQKKPRQQRGNVQGNFLMHSKNAGIYVNKMVAKLEYIEMIDDYFTRFGYQVNTTKAITITNRENFDYVQTTDCNLTGDIPQEDIEELEAIFDRGLTIWHNENTYGDWNVSNRGWGDIT